MSEKTLHNIRLHLVGCGKMGSALLKSWLLAGVDPDHITARVARDSSAELLASVYGIRTSTTMRYDREDVVVLAVKPQMLDGILPEYAAASEPLFISIAAGRRLEYFVSALGANKRIIRAMPNTPAQVGQGVTTLAAGKEADSHDIALATALFEASGSAIWLEEEGQIDAATAIAGSGPAYVFHFAECLMEAARSLGLPEAVVRDLVSGTLRGSVALADTEGWHDLAQLRRDVTSKGGVTEAALAVLMPSLSPLVQEALRANVERAKALA